MRKIWILACALATWVLEGGLGEGFERILEGFWNDFEDCKGLAADAADPARKKCHIGSQCPRKAPSQKTSSRKGKLLWILMGTKALNGGVTTWI